jgi:Na+/H+-translocating membrane pyrophosphatase
MNRSREYHSTIIVAIIGLIGVVVTAGVTALYGDYAAKKEEIKATTTAEIRATQAAERISTTLELTLESTPAPDLVATVEIALYATLTAFAPPPTEIPTITPTPSSTPILQATVDATLVALGAFNISDRSASPPSTPDINATVESALHATLTALASTLVETSTRVVHPLTDTPTSISESVSQVTPEETATSALTDVRATIAANIKNTFDSYNPPTATP